MTSTGSDTHGWSEDPTVGLGEGGAADAPDQGGVIGRYVVIEVIGEGGMGRVLRAYDPKLRREVALKLLRFEADVGARERLVAEAQAMARLSHPNVLPVFDFDLDGDRPYIAMEYVEGTTLRYWIRHESPSRARIVAAFVAAGAGLAAAHSVGLVHCDFKPSNVLRGSDGRIRVLDFGLAFVALAGAGLDDDPSTRGAEPRRTEVLGSPAYMAPEQHRGQTLDARSDQYSFAVSLWEALYGEQPFQAESFEELARAKEELRLAAVDPRSSVPGALRRVLLRGLAPDPVDRFPSMDAMLTELRKEPGRTGRLVTTLGIGIVGVGGVWGWSVQQGRAREAECRAQGEEIDAVWGPSAIATVQAAFESATPDYAADTFARTRPWLDRYAAQWATMRTELCLREDTPASAEDQQMRAAAVSCLGERKVELEALVELLHQPDAEVVAMAVPGAADLSPLEACLDASYLATVPSLPSDPATREAVATLRGTLVEVEVLSQAGRYEAADAGIEAALQEAEALGHEPLIAEARLIASRVARVRGRYQQGRARAEQAFDLAARLGLDDITASAAIELTSEVGLDLAEPGVGLLWARFGDMVIDRRDWEDRPIHALLLSARGRVHALRAEHDAAQAAYEHALRIERATLGDEHPRVADTWNDLGSLADQRKDRDAAIEYHQKALALRKAIFGPGHPQVAASLNNLGNAHWGRGELGIAAELLQESARIKEAAYGAGHVRLMSTVQNLGNVLYSQGRYAEAIEYWNRALEIGDAALPAAHPTRASVLGNLAAGYLAVEDLDAALESARKAIDVAEQVQGADHISLASMWRTLGAVHQARGELPDALRCVRRELEIVLAAHGEAHPSVAETHRELGKLLLVAGDRAGALVELEQAATLLVRHGASERERALVDVQILEALEGQEPTTVERRAELERSVRAVLCDGEEPPELCREAASGVGAQG